MNLSVTHNFPQVAAALDQLSANIRQRAAASALNKTMDQAKTAMAREIVADYAVSSSYVKERLRVHGASASTGALNIEARLVGGNGRHRAANIIAFVEKSTTLAQARKRTKAGTLSQLHVKVKRSGGFKPLKGAFIGNNGRTVFERTGNARLPIRPVQVIDVAQMFNTKRINSAVMNLISTKFPEIFAREVSFYLRRSTAK